MQTKMQKMTLFYKKFAHINYFLYLCIEFPSTTNALYVFQTNLVRMLR